MSDHFLVQKTAAHFKHPRTGLRRFGKSAWRCFNAKSENRKEEGRREKESRRADSKSKGHRKQGARERTEEREEGSRGRKEAKRRKLSAFVPVRGLPKDLPSQKNQVTDLLGFP